MSDTQAGAEKKKKEKTHRKKRGPKGQHKMGRDKVHPEPKKVVATAGGAEKKTKPARSNTKNQLLDKSMNKIIQRSSSVAVEANRDILKRFQKLELEEGQLVEYIEDPGKPQQKKLCQIMLINDADTPTYNLRWCTDEQVENNIFEYCEETKQVEVFRNGGVHKETLRLIVKYDLLTKGKSMQVLQDGKWFNCEILSCSHSETAGAHYEVQLVTKPGEPKSTPLQGITYDLLRRKTKPKHKLGDLVELRMDSEKNDDGRANPYFPAIVLEVLDSSPIAGGIAYQVEYYLSGVVNQGKPKTCVVAPIFLRHRFSIGNSKVKSYAEFFETKDNEGWIKCSVEDVLSDGTYKVNVDNGEAEIVTAYAKDLQLYLGVGENALRRSDGRPVTIVQLDDASGTGRGGEFMADVHLESDIQRQIVDRNDLQRITLTDLRRFGIENDQDADLVTKPSIRNDILDKIDDIVKAKDNGAFVTSCHGINPEDGTTINHTANVFAVAFSPDGRFFVTGDVKGNVSMFDGMTGRMLEQNFYKYGGRRNAWIVNMSFSGSGSRLAICFLGGVVILSVEVQDGIMVRTGSATVTPDGHEGGCLACDFSKADETLMVTGGYDGKVCFWRVHGERVEVVGSAPVKPLLDSETMPCISMVIFDPLGKYVAVAAGDGNCYIYTLVNQENGRVSVHAERNVLAHGHSDEATCLCYSHGEGHLLATGGRDNVAIVWSAGNGDMLARLTNGHVRDITSVAFDPSNKFLVTASDDRRIILWDALTAEKVGVLLGQHSSGVNMVAFQPKTSVMQSSALVSVGNDERVLLWKPGGLRWRRIVKDDNRKGSKKRKDFKPIKALACHPAQQWLIFSESCDGRVMSQVQAISAHGYTTRYLAKMDGSPVFCLSDPFTRHCEPRAPPGANPKDYKKSGRMQFSNFSKGKYKNGWTCNGVPNKENDFRTCANKHHKPSEMRFFCMPCGFNLCLTCSGVDGHSMSVNSIDISSDGNFACSVADDSTCIVWDMSKLHPLPQEPDPKKKRKDPFGVLPFYRGEDGNHSVQLSSFKFHERGATSVRIAPSDLHFVTSSKQEFLSAVWEFDRETPNQKPLYLLEGGVGADFVDRDSVVTASKHIVRLYNLQIAVATGEADKVFDGAAKGKPVDLITGHEDIVAQICMTKRMDKLGSLTAIAVCSKIFKNFCAVGDSFGNIAMLGLGVDRNRSIYPLEGAAWRHHVDQVTCMAFSPNGHNLATASSDMTVRIYSIRVITPKAEINADGVRQVEVEPCYMTAGGTNPFPKIRMNPDLHVQAPTDVEFVGHMAPVCSVAFSTTGSELYSGDEAGHIINWWWRADPHVDFSLAALAKDNSEECVTEWMHLLSSAFEFPRIGFNTDLALCNTVDIDSGVQLLTMLMSNGCFAGVNREQLFSSLFYSEGDDDDAVKDHATKNSFLAGAIAGGTNCTHFMKPNKPHEASRSPLEIIFSSKDVMDERSYNLKYGTSMLKYWLAMGKSCMYSEITLETPELLVNFLHISAAVSKILPTIAKHKIELAKDILEKWSHSGLSLVTNPYAAFLMAQDGPHKFSKLYSVASGVESEILDILPDSSATPFGESLLWVDAQGFELNHKEGKVVAKHDKSMEKYHIADPTDPFSVRTEQFRFKVSAKVKAGSVAVVPCVFSLPFVSKDIEDSILHVLAGEEELFDCVFDDTADTEFKASPGLAILVNFKWRQYAKKEYLARFFTYMTHYICYSIFCYGLVFERAFFEAPPCNVFSENSVMGDWADLLENCTHSSPSFESMLDSSLEDYNFNLGNLVFYFVMGGITLFFSLYHLIMMIVQNRSQGCASFFGSSINSNYLDLATYIMMAVTVSMFLARSVQAGAVGSVTSVLAGWKFMLSWRGFSNTSHYIRTIIEITRFSYIFLFMMIFFSIGCGWAFMLLFGGWQEVHLAPLGIAFEGADGANQYELFSTFWRTIVTSWDFMVGNTDIEAWLDSYYELIAIPLFFFFSFMVVLVMLNLVIALMADGYTEVMETKSKAKIKERANIIVGIEKTMNSSVFTTDKARFPVWVHALMKKNSDGSPIGDMPASFNDQVGDSLTSLLSSLNQLKEERLADKAAMQKLQETIDDLVDVQKSKQ